MKLATTELLKELSEYQFFNWEDDEQNEFNLIIGMPDEKLKKKTFTVLLDLNQSRTPILKFALNQKNGLS